jgi:hypothetical protein
MLVIRYFSITFIVVFSCTASMSQDLQKSITLDSLMIDTTTYTPYYKNTKNQSTHYSKKIDDNDVLKLSAGVSIFNSLRGQVPSLGIPAYFANAQSTVLRNNIIGLTVNTNIMVDGLPFNNGIGRYLNTNAFEYSSISIASSANATSFINGSNNGSFFITSKTGEGHYKPMFEFNSSTTNGWQEVTSPTGKTQLNEWYLSNSLAYSQDFGAVDLRVSYNFLNWNSDLPLVNFTPNRHNFKINSGFNIANKLKARLIVDGMYSSTSRRSEFTIVPPPTSVDESLKEAFYQGNLTMQYQVLPWLNLSSQWSLSQRDSSSSRTVPQDFTARQIGDQRLTGNLFANIDKQLSRKFKLNGFLGYQSIAQQRNLRNNVNLGYTDFNSSLSIPHWAAGAVIGYKEMINLESTVRWATYSYLPSSDNQQSNYSLGSSFVFSKVWKPSFLSFGKIRGNWGKFSYEPLLGYPFENRLSALRNPTMINTTEIGLDVLAFKSSLKVTFNYFASDQVLNVNQGVVNVFDRRLLKGWDSELSYEFIKNSSLSIQLGLLLSSIQEGFQAKGVSTLNYGSPNTRNSVLLKLKTNKLLLITLVDAAKFSDALVSSSFIKLRDVSIGYKMQARGLTNLGVKEATLSLTGRNLYVISSTGVDFESLYLVNAGMQKSITANLNLVF